jgi:hypothetical protein
MRLFVGRGAELSRLSQFASAPAAPDAPNLALVLGEEGIGKTALLDRLARHCAEHTVVRVAVRDETWKPPYEVAGAALNALETRVGSDRFDRAVERPALLAPLAHELNEGQPAPEPALPELTEAFASVLGRLSDDAPILVLVDDLHHADRSSLDFLHRLLPRLTAHPIRFVCASERALPLSDWELPGDPLALPLAGVSHDALHHLATSVLDRAADRSWVVSLDDYTGGNLLLSTAVIRMALGPRALRAPAELPTPAEAVSLALRQLRTIPREARHLVFGASVLAAPSAVDRALHVGGMPQNPDGALEGALASGLVVRANRPGWIEPRSPLLARAVLDTLPTHRRRQLLRRVHQPSPQTPPTNGLGCA